VIAFDKRRHRLQTYGYVEVIIFVLYPGVCSTCFSALFCRGVSADLSVLGTDYSIDCGSDGYGAFFYVAVLCIVLLPIGVPAFMYFQLWSHRERILAGDLETCRQFDSLIGNYEPQFYYWEIVEMARKLTMTGFIMFVAPGSSIQVATAILATFIFFAFGLWSRPMLYSQLDVVKALGEFIVFLVMLGMLLAKTELEESELEALGTAIAYIVLACVLGMVGIVVWTIKNSGSEPAAEEEADDETLTNYPNPLDTMTKTSNPLYEINDEDTSGENLLGNSNRQQSQDIGDENPTAPAPAPAPAAAVAAAVAPNHAQLEHERISQAARKDTTIKMMPKESNAENNAEIAQLLARLGGSAAPSEDCALAKREAALRAESDALFGPVPVIRDPETFSGARAMFSTKIHHTECSLGSRSQSCMFRGCCVFSSAMEAVRCVLTMEGWVGSRSSTGTATRR
jgi:hypothetical protein